DVFVRDVKPPPGGRWKEVHIAIETKVKAKIDKAQCSKYSKWFAQQRAKGILTIPVFIAPTDYYADDKTAEDLFGDGLWIGLDYQKVYSDVLEPCLRHPNISGFGKLVLSEFVK